MVFATDTATQKTQMEALLAETEQTFYSNQGIAIVGDNFNQAGLDYLAGRFKRPTQFDFEAAWENEGLSLPLIGDALFNWMSVNGDNQGIFSSVKYDRFCIPITIRDPYGQNYARLRSDSAYSSKKMGIPLVLTVDAWMTDTMLLGYAYMFRHANTGITAPATFQLALDGSHRVVIKAGRMFEVDIENDTFLLYQRGFVRRENISDYSDLNNITRDWYDIYSSALEGTYNLLGVSVLYGKFDEWYPISSISPYLWHSSKLGYTFSGEAQKGLQPDGRIWVASAADGNGRFSLTNSLMGVGTPNRSIELRSDASIEIRFTDSYVPQTNGMPRIAFWGANSAALPANANTVPANGWCLKWSSKYDTLSIWKDGVSQGSWAITPPSTVAEFSVWVEVIQSGTIYEVYFNGTLLGSVTSTYAFTHKAVGFFAYNRDVAAATTAIDNCYLLEFHIGTFSNLVGGVRSLNSNGTDTQFYYIDKHGKYCIHTMPSRVLTRVSVTNPSVDNLLVVGTTHVAIVSLAGDYIEFRNKTTGALVQTVNVSADPNHFGYTVEYSAAESGFRLYNRGSLFDGYTLYTEAGLATPVTSFVAMNFTELKVTLEELIDSSPFNYDATGNIRGNRYWNTFNILKTRIKSGLSWLRSPNNRNIAVLGQYSDGFVAVFANEDAGITQTGKVWMISDFAEKQEAPIKVLKEIMAGDNVTNTNWYHLDEDGVNVDYDTVFRVIGYGSPAVNGTPSFGTMLIHGNAAVVSYPATVDMRTGIGTLFEIWIYGNAAYLLVFSTSTGAAATNRLTFGVWGNNLSSIMTAIFSFGVHQWLTGSAQVNVEQIIRGHNGYNYMV